MSMISVPLFAIGVPADRARDLDPAWAEALAGVIAAQGLQHPIRLRATGTQGEDDGWRLVSGLHRLEAARLLGWTEIAATVSAAAGDDEARLEEVMENLGRHELIALDRCHHLHELKEVWERLHPEAAVGRHTNRGNQHQGGRAQGLRSSSDGGNQHQSGRRQTLPSSAKSNEVFGFARENAEKIGLSDRSIRYAVKIWKGLAPAVKPRLRGTDLARKMTELKALSELKAPIQMQVLDIIFDPENTADNVAAALMVLESGIGQDSAMRRYAGLFRAFGNMGEHELDGLIEAHADRVVASLHRLGRL